jgi:histidinol dehydrogenase
MLVLDHQDPAAFRAAVDRLRARGTEDFDAVEPVVREILADVRRRGDAAVLRYVDVHERRRPDPLVRRSRFGEGAGFDGEGALARLAPDVRAALELAARRIRAFHERQVQVGFSYTEAGITLGTRVLPLRRVGVYAPGGKARYPSSVLMAAIPAQVAGVEDLVLATPLSGGASTSGDDLVLAAAHLAGVTTLLDAGGAHAIAAMAFGTESLPRVDKIVGPGNAYVTCAKRLVFGEVDIDGIAGPSEVVVLADDTAHPAVVASDLLSQAEHDEAAMAVLITTSAGFAERCRDELARRLESMARRDIAARAIADRGVCFVVDSRQAMLELAEDIGAEHLALHLADAGEVAATFRTAGAIFVGPFSPVAAGDYLAGPSHVLPTGSACRFGSPLGVYDFVVRRSVIEYRADSLAGHADAIAALAHAEGLPGHADSVTTRLDHRGDMLAAADVGSNRPPLKFSPAHAVSARSVSDGESGP